MSFYFTYCSFFVTDIDYVMRMAELSVQRNIAEATTSMLYVSYFQVIISALGVVGLIATIYLTRKSVQNAIASTKSAYESIEHNKKVSKLQLMAYVNAKIEDACRIQPNEEKWFSVNITNAGATPAYISEACAFMEFNRDVNIAVNSYPVASRNHIVGSGETICVKFRFFENISKDVVYKADFDPSIPGEYALYGVRINYTDIFDDEHVVYTRAASAYSGIISLPFPI
jgi:hypothetical protein